MFPVLWEATAMVVTGNVKPLTTCGPRGETNAVAAAEEEEETEEECARMACILPRGGYCCV